MIKRQKASISKCILHKVGNKFNTTKNLFSEKEMDLDEHSYQLMLNYLLRSFGSVVESYRFNHHSNIALNEIYSYATQLFSDEKEFVNTSKHIVNHLFEQSNSAQIKTGDVLICLFNDLEYQDTMVNAIGIFKIENKSEFFQTYLENRSYEILTTKGISTKKVDKGCLILNTSDAEGNIVLSVDHNSYDAQYWIKNFLNMKYPDDYNQHTKNYLQLCKDFSNDVIKPSSGLQERSSFLAKTVDFFKENEVINVENFKNHVFEDEQHKTLFDSYKKDFETYENIVIRNQFDVSEQVLKKQKPSLKTEIRLDTNIQIKLDVDAPDASAEYLERGYDEVKKMHYYKVFFNEEG